MTDDSEVPVAEGGLLSRRHLLGGALAAPLLMAGREVLGAAPGGPMLPVGRLSEPSAALARIGIGSQPGTKGSGASRTPLEHLSGTLTPSRLHFERHHAGVPSIDADVHELKIFGLVEQSKAFSVEQLARYPMETRYQFLECSGNSGVMIAPEPAQNTAGGLHGLVSESEWTGVPVRYLLEEVGLAKRARWAIADGADAAHMARSVPLQKLLDDALIALYQNGEPLRPENGYPMRLFLPGWEGNASVKWLRHLKLTDQPGYTKDETSKYTDRDADGRAAMFTFQMGVKSIITSPSLGLDVGESGVYQVSGLAWSGAGRIRRVDVSADGGRTWAEAQLDSEPKTKSLTRFRLPWRWQGQSVTLVSRAVDETGAVQPTRQAVLEGRGVGAFYHYNGMQAWHVNSGGKVSHVYV